MVERLKVGLVIILSAMSFSLSGQNCYKKIEQSLIDCGLLIYSQKFESDIKRLIIETDSINSKKYSKIIIEPFDSSIKISDYNKVDSLIRINYNGSEILSSQRTTEIYGVLYCYVVGNPKGNPYFNRCVIRYFENIPLLMIYSSIMGSNSEYFGEFACMINKKE